MKKQAPYSAFTIKHNVIISQLRTPVNIISGSNQCDGVALWDTGASGSCISDRIVHNLRLIPTGRQKVLTPSGETTVNTYMVDVILPNGVTIKDVPVCDSDIGKQGLDMLIGMDIIKYGDMTITNYNNRTFFTFRIPSQGAADYVMQSSIKGRWK